MTEYDWLQRGHRLSPQAGQPYLSPKAVVERLGHEFAQVRLDREAGGTHVDDLIAQFVRLKASLGVASPPEVTAAANIDERIAFLERVRDEAVIVSLADDGSVVDGCFHFALIAEDPIVISYESRRHEELTAPLVDRLARLLNYEAEHL